MQRLIIALLFAISVSLNAQEIKKLVILHNNDMHSRIDPFPNGDSPYAGMGGIVRQNAYVEEVRRENSNVLLFGSGDFVQGTPYFNVFKGEVEIACMNFMKYDAVCLGNHEFDNGLSDLAKMIQSAHFPVVATNLDFTGTLLEGLTHPYVIIKRDGLKIGVIGVTISLEGLVPESNYRGVNYLDPIQAANKTAALLKNQEDCDLVICLSHLGYNAGGKRVDDITLAEKSENIDIILGGHSHTLLRFADRRLNKNGAEVIINQVGDRGVYMGRLDVLMTLSRLSACQP